MADEGMAQFNIHDARTHLSRVIDQTEDDKEITFGRADASIATVAPRTHTVRRVGRSSLRGRLALAESRDSHETNQATPRDVDRTP